LLHRRAHAASSLARKPSRPVDSTRRRGCVRANSGANTSPPGLSRWRAGAGEAACGSRRPASRVDLAGRGRIWKLSLGIGTEPSARCRATVPRLWVGQRYLALRHAALHWATRHWARRRRPARTSLDATA
jgi:hypothetical protein